MLSALVSAPATQTDCDVGGTPTHPYGERPPEEVPPLPDAAHRHRLRRARERAAFRAGRLPARAREELLVHRPPRPRGGCHLGLRRQRGLRRGRDRRHGDRPNRWARSRGGRHDGALGGARRGALGAPRAASAPSGRARRAPRRRALARDRRAEGVRAHHGGCRCFRHADQATDCGTKVQVSVRHNSEQEAPAHHGPEHGEAAELQQRVACESQPAA